MAWRSIGARAFIGVTTLAGCTCLVFAFREWHPTDPFKFACYLIVALLASSLKVTLPRVEGTLSVNFLFTIVGILELSLPETLIIGLASTLGQFYWRSARRLKLVQLVFNLSQVTLSSTIAYSTYRLTLIHVPQASEPLAVLVATIVYFGCNSAAMSTIIGLTDSKSIFNVWIESYSWSSAYYLVGGAAAGLISLLNRHIAWQSSLLVLPPIYLIYRSYRLYLGKLETEARMNQQTSNLHLRTIEALALAIEAKDESTSEHLQRVRVYAVELGKELGLSDDEKAALKAAAVLHDIGKFSRSGAHHRETREVESGGIREDEDSSHCRGGNSRTSQFSLPGSADCTSASREMEWDWVPQRIGWRGDSNWRTHTRRSRLS
jgi:hypothetical protein